MIIINNSKQIQMQSEDKVQYTSFNELSNPEMSSITVQTIEHGFQSKDWRTQFQTLTTLRQANRFYSNVFLTELLPIVHKSIALQVDNLRSNNSKEALTLVYEILEHQNLEEMKEETIRGLISSLFTKSFCEKAFLKNEALKGLETLPKKKNRYIISQLNKFTDSHNASICELAIKILSDYMHKNNITEVDQEFWKALSRNINGKRAIIQKKSRQILEQLKARKGEKQLLVEISNFSQLNEDQSNTLKKQISNSNSTKTKPQQSFKDFIKVKKTTNVENVENMEKQ